MAHSNASIEKNVEAVLLKTKIFRRRPGAVPYPVARSSHMSNFDIWDNMFFNTTCRSLTMHQMDKPPTVVLDLGCGSGYWAIEAAKQWKHSTIIGYDLLAMQPRLSAQYHKDIARRVKWVHGNLLDGLPFPSSHFDFIRIVNIGLGVPEDEWQFVLEEVARVMKSGAAVEVIEEDPIFPCSKPPPQRPRSRPRPSPITVNLTFLDSAPSSAYSSKSSATLSTTTFTSEPFSAMLDERFELASSKSTQSFFDAPASIIPKTPYSTPSLLHADTPRASSISDPEQTPDPRDHSKLKTAWDAMLSSRFLATNLLSVLPFYLSSTFVDVQTRAPFKVTLPPNSDSKQTLPSRRSGDSYTESLYQSTICSDDSYSLAQSPQSDKNLSFSYEQLCPYSSSWSGMHLARTVNTVTGCKEAMWHEYKNMYALDIMRTKSDKDKTPYFRPESAIRDDFDAEWTSWENDMQDRIGMRGSITSLFGWAEPPGEKPDWRVWRTAVAKVERFEENLLSNSRSAGQDIDICRSMRGFVGWKP